MADLWEEWKRITRFLESGRVAFARERELWASLAISEPDKIEIVIPPGRYQVHLPEHLEALADDETLHAAVLLHSYALTESAAADRLGIDSRNLGQVEDWGWRLLDANGRTVWPEQVGGKVGVVEVAVVRNAFAHSNRVLDQTSFKRLESAGGSSRSVGSLITLTYTELVDYHIKLKALLRAGGLG